MKPAVECSGFHINSVVVVAHLQRASWEYRLQWGTLSRILCMLICFDLSHTEEQPGISGNREDRECFENPWSLFRCSECVLNKCKKFGRWACRFSICRIDKSMNGITGNQQLLRIFIYDGIFDCNTHLRRFG